MLQKRLIYLLFLFIGISVQGYGQKRLEVGKDKAFTSVRKAINNAQPFDTVLIYEGYYKEADIQIDKPLVIEGINYPEIDGSGDENAITVTSDSVTIRGISVVNVSTNYMNDLAAITLIKASYCTLENNRLRNNFFGIFLQRSNFNLIQNNRIEGNSKEDEVSSGNAVHLWYSKNNRILNNETLKHRDGIYLEFADFTTIKGNFSHDQIRYGLHFMFSNNCKYIGNEFENNGAGVAVMFSRNILMRYNHFRRNWGSASYGLLLKEIYDAEVVNNQFTENTIAIYGESATRIKFLNNSFKDNGWGFKLLGSCYDNIVSENNFINNNFDFVTNVEKSSNTISKNYWSEYSGYDLDRNGVGDIPHRPIKLFSVVTQVVPDAIILNQSLFVQLLDLAEKVNPTITSVHIKDPDPVMKPWRLFFKPKSND
ncbi:MAG: nitrous oxide reductase family maturation protein NosD [Cytophagales bacterium]|nr:nitrous oxide reductase family maturation protein NosD [Cytophagales bacterium]